MTKWISSAAARGAWLVIGIAGALAACNDDDDTTTPDPSTPNTPNTPAPTSPTPTTPVSETQKAEDRFWAAMGTADWQATEGLVGTFKDLKTKDPNDVRAITLHGLTSLWRIAESDRLADPQQIQAITQATAPGMMESLEAAHQKDPKNTVLTSFYATVCVDFGTFSKNEGLVAKGRALFAQAKAEDPLIGNSFQILTLRTLPPNSADFDAALEASWQWFDDCAKQKIDRESPDFEGWLKTLGTIDDFKGSRKFCGDTDKAPYALRTMLLTVGDALVAKGKVEAAKKAYLATHVLRDKPFVPAPAWPHADAVEARLSSNLDARAKSYSDPDPSKWAEMGTNPSSCTVCHATTAK